MENSNQIWDNILKADRKLQIIGTIRQKKQQIEKLPTVCGSCSLWMTAQCDREKRLKVSNGMPTCSDFKQEKWVSDLIDKLNIEIANLQSELTDK